MTDTAPYDAFAFFHKHAGYSYDPYTQTEEYARTQNAHDLGDAEALASQRGYGFRWGIDPDTDSSDFSDDPDTWSLWCCQMIDPAGKTVESLWAIDFGRDNDPWGQPYRRVVEAELALEHFKE